MKRMILTLLLSCLVSTAWSADYRGQFASYGAPTCKKYLEAAAKATANRNDSTDFLLMWAWISGYITSYNANVPDTRDILGDLKPLQMGVGAHCTEHPESDVTQFLRTRTSELYFVRRR